MREGRRALPFESCPIVGRELTYDTLGLRANTPRLAEATPGVTLPRRQKYPIDVWPVIP